MADWWEGDPKAGAVGDQWWSADPVSAPAPITAGDVISSTLDVPVLGSLARKAEAATYALGGPSEKLPEPTFGERYQHHLRSIEQPLETFREQHPIVAGLTNFGGTLATTGGLGATTAGARLLGMAPAGAGLVGQAVRGALSGGGISAADAALRGENPLTAAVTGGAIGAAVPAAVRAIGVALPGAAKAVTPTVDELKASAKAGYQHPEVAAVEIKPQAVSRLSAQIENDLTGSGFRPAITPKAFGVAAELKPPAGTTSVNLADMDSVQKALRQVAREVDAVGRPTPDSAAASKALGHIDNFLENLKQPDLLAGDASKAVPILREAGLDWGAARRAEDLGVRLTRAERQAAKSGSGTNIQNAIKQKVSAVLDVPARSVGYSDAEKAAAEAVVRGSALENSLRKAGKLGFGDGLSLLLHGGAAFQTGGLSLPVGIAGTIARKAAERMTEAKAARLEEMLRQRSPLYRSRAAAMGTAAPLVFPGLETALRAQSTRGGVPSLYFPS